MPISVTCPGCSAKFGVKDEYAGRSGKCPKCGGPITIPAAAAPTVNPADTVRMPPRTARPATVQPRVVEDNEDETPKPKVKPRADDDAEAPTTKGRRRRDQDDEDDRPKSKRRRDADDEPKKKKSALPLVLGILGGLVLLCGGGFAAVWFLVIVPAAEQAKAKFTGSFNPPPSGDQQPPIVPPHGSGGEVSAANLARVREGMTLAEVEAILGKGKKADLFSVAMTTADQTNSAEVSDRWNAKQRQGHVLDWQKFPDHILVAFSTDPDAGGTVVGLLGSIGRSGSEPLKLGGGTTTNTSGKEVDPKTLPNYPVVTLTATDFIKNYAKYKDKWIVVTGKLKNDLRPLKEDEKMNWADVVLDHEGLPIRFRTYSGGGFGGSIGLKAGTELEIWGKVTGLSPEGTQLELEECLCQNQALEVDSVTMMQELLNDGPAAIKKYRHRPLKISGTVTDAFGKVLPGSMTRPKTFQVQCSALEDETLNLKPGDHVVILTNNAVLFTQGPNKNVSGLPDGRIISVKR